MNSSKNPHYAEAGRTATDAGNGNNADNSWWEEHGKRLVLIGLAILFGGILIYIADRQNDDTPAAADSTPPPGPGPGPGPGPPGPNT